jgi:NTE family protein
VRLRGKLETMVSSPLTALVLSGGGLVGGAWMIGALHAIAAETGWDPGSADQVMGTSAGAMIGALLASAAPPWLLMAYATGTRLDGLPEVEGGTRDGKGQTFGATFRLHWSFPRPVLGSPSLALRSLREPWRYGPAGIMAWLPQGVISTEPLKKVIRNVVPRGWSPHPGLRAVAIDYASGERVVFGRAGAPVAELCDAVAASCAIPGFYHPVTIGGRRYVDGGMYTPSNLDLLLGGDAELIVCLNPMSSRVHGGVFEPTGRLASLVRGNNQKQVERECAALEREGKRVLLIQPHHADIKVMGFNYMSRRNVDRVVESAVRTTTATLLGTDIGRRLRTLPSGSPARLRRPSQDPSQWPAELFPPLRRSA